MVSPRVCFPQPPVDPEVGIGHRPVVRRFGGAPEEVQAVRRFDELVIYYKFVVVHDEAAVYGREISNDGGDGN